MHYGRTYGAITRINNKPVITISSNILGTYQSQTQSIVGKVQAAINNFNTPSGVAIELTGEQQDQKETVSFLGKALMIAIMLIFMTLITQFNSLSKPLIILTEVVFSVVGIILGYGITKMDVSSIMSGLGFVALAGIVVRNGILLVEFTDILVAQGYSVKDAVIEAGRIRMTPVILTSVATILGLIPLGLGLNIDFGTLFTDLNPHIFFGGDSVAFWGPLSWTMIFGLSFATFLTLVVVPVLYYGSDRFNAIVKESTKGGMFKNSFSFKGRIRRAEFGLSFLMSLVALILLSIVNAMANTPAFSVVYGLGFLFISYFMYAQGAKRSHDIGYSGWMQLIPIWNFRLFVRDGQPYENEYGANPKSALGQDAKLNPIIAN